MSTIEWWMLLWAICCYGGAFYLSGVILKLFFACLRKAINAFE